MFSPVGWEQKLAGAFGMSDAVSVWTRYPVLPLLALAVWSRTWLHGWALAPVALLLIWTWLNPRVFAVPTSTDNWASKAVLGERVWLNRERVPIPPHHHRVLFVLHTLTGLGLAVALYGLAVFDAWASTIGLIVVVLGKSWFLDRMVWLFDEMIDAHPTYRTWMV